MTEFTSEELELLYESLNAWEQEPVRTGMMSLVIGNAFIKDEQERDRNSKENIAQQERDKKARERKAIVLKAKIVIAIEAAATDGLFSQNSNQSE